MAPNLSYGIESNKLREQLFETVTVAEVNSENLNIIWPCLIGYIRKAQLVSIDLELSGLGNRTGRVCTMSERYKKIRETAQTRSILSIGVATFQFNGIDTERRKELRYKCRVFDFLALEEKPFVVEPEALRFLSSHGFDFNRLLTHGIRYMKTDSSYGGVFHSLWEEILASGVCIAFHNGLTDLAFIHEHFYAPLPESCDQFTANLADWFGKREPEVDYWAMDCALWDSKYIAENHQQAKNFSGSYLYYVFRKAQRDNQRFFQNEKPHLAIKVSKSKGAARNATKFSYFNCSLKKSFISGEFANVCQEMLCRSYMRFGHCRNQMNCEKAHDVDLLLDLEDKRAQLRRKKERRRRSKKGQSEGEEEGIGDNEKDSESDKGITTNAEEDRKCGTKRKKESLSQIQGEVDGRTEHSSTDTLSRINRTSGCHRAGMDAFMTGFAVLFFKLDHTYRDSGRLGRQLSGYVALPGKEVPLLICKSSFITQKESHQLNWTRVESRRKAFDRAKYEKWTRKAGGGDNDAHTQP